MFYPILGHGGYCVEDFEALYQISEGLAREEYRCFP